MILALISLLSGFITVLLATRVWNLEDKDRTTEIYTCSCGSGSHYWLSNNKLECRKCGQIKEVNHNGIIVS